MSLFEKIKEEAKKNPGVVVIPEYEIDKDSVLKEAMEIVKKEGTAIPLGLTYDIIEKSEKIEEFADAYPMHRNLEKGTRIKLMQKPIPFAIMMVKLGYAHAMMAGKYKESSIVMSYVDLLVKEQRGKIRSAIFFHESQQNYNLIAIADVVANPHPSAKELYKLIITSAETYEALTNKKPKIALLSYVTGEAKQIQLANDPELRKIKKCLRIYQQRNHKWLVYQTQVDSALNPKIAEIKGVPFDEPADLWIASNLFVSNSLYKLREQSVKGNSMIITQGKECLVQDMSRGDTALTIANGMAACSLLAKKSNKTIDDYFLKFI